MNLTDENNINLIGRLPVVFMSFYSVFLLNRKWPYSFLSVFLVVIGEK